MPGCAYATIKKCVGGAMHIAETKLPYVKNI
jgi:hypothetical protein